MEHAMTGFSAALLLAQEYGEMIRQDNKKNTSTFKFYQSGEIYIFDHRSRSVTIKKGSECVTSN